MPLWEVSFKERIPNFYLSFKNLENIQCYSSFSTAVTKHNDEKELFKEGFVRTERFKK